MPHLADDDIGDRLQPVGRQAAHAQQLGGRADWGERVAQLVRQHGQELVLAPVRLAQVLLGAHAFCDVERDPAHGVWLAVGIAAHLAADVEPQHAAIVGTAEAHDLLVAAALGDGARARAQHALHVLGMNRFRDLVDVVFAAAQYQFGVVREHHVAGGDIPVPHQHARRVHALGQAFGALFAGPLGQVGIADIVALHKNAGDLAILAEQGLVQDIDIAFPERSFGQVLQLHFQTAADKRLAAAEHLVEQFRVALQAHLGQGLRHRFADQVAVPHQFVIGRVDHLEHVALATEHGNEAGRLVEQAAQVAALVVQDARHGLVQLGVVKTVDAVVLRHRLDPCHLVGAVVGIQTGDVDRILDHEGDLAVGAAHRGVHGAPVALLEVLPLGSLTWHRIAQEGDRVRLAAVERALHRIAHPRDIGRRRIVGVFRKRVEHMASQQIGFGAAGAAQIGFVGGHDVQADIHDEIGIGGCAEQRLEVGSLDHPELSHEHSRVRARHGKKMARPLARTGPTVMSCIAYLPVLRRSAPIPASARPSSASEPGSGTSPSAASVTSRLALK